MARQRTVPEQTPVGQFSKDDFTWATPASASRVFFIKASNAIMELGVIYIASAWGGDVHLTFPSGPAVGNIIVSNASADGVYSVYYDLPDTSNVYTLSGVAADLLFYWNGSNWIVNGV